MKRYDSYKDSGVQWVGEIPNHWEIIKGKYCTKVICGLPFDSNKFTKEEGYIGLIRIRDISNNVTDMNYMGKYPKEALVHTGEILIGMDGDFNIEKWKGDDALLNQRVCKIVDTKTVLSNYMYYLLPRPLKCINDVTYSTTVKHLSTFDIANLTLPLPPASEQQAIASYLDKRCDEIDKAIAKQQKRIELLQELRQNIITNAVTRGINPDAPLKDSGVEWIGQVPEHWEIMKIKHVVTTNSGSTPKNIKGKDTDEANIIWVRTTDLTGYVVKDSSEYLTEEEFKSASCPLLPEGTVLVAMYGGAGTIGKCGILGREATINQALCSLIGKRGVTQLFLFYCTLAMKGYWMKFAASSRKDPNISQEIIRNVMIPIPPEKEQNEIVQFVVSETKEIDDSIKQANKRIALLQELKQSIITEVVTGKRKVC